MPRLIDLPRLIDYSCGEEPYWGEDAGRNSMTGDFSGTFNGYYTTIDLSFGKCTQQELYAIKQVLQKPIFPLTYPDPDTQNASDKTENFYGTVIKPTKTNLNGKYEPFTVQIVGTTKKSNANFQ